MFNWNWLSIVIKGALGIAVLLLSAILSYAFFQGISPAGMAVFPFAALTLTEGGFVGWILIFATMKHHKINGLIALLMIIACFITTVTVTLAELIQLFQDHSLVNNATVQNGTLILLEIMLALHVLAAASDFLIGKIEWLSKYTGQNADVVDGQGYTIVEPQRPTGLPKPKKGLVGAGKTLLFGDEQPSTPVQLPQQASTHVQGDTVDLDFQAFQEWKKQQVQQANSVNGHNPK